MLTYEQQARYKLILLESERIRDALDNAPPIDWAYVHWLWEQPSQLSQDPRWWLRQPRKCCW